MKPLAIDLYCGLGGWAEGFLAEGWRVKGYDIVRHDYGTGGYPGELILRDVRSLCGSKFRNASCFVASPPCQEPSYRAMPWSRAKVLNAEGPPVNFIALFDACFRIQREASEAAGRYIPLIVENVRGAQRWVGRARWHFGSYYLWGDVPALMPMTGSVKFGGARGDDWFVHHNRESFAARAGVKIGERRYHRDGESHTRHLTNPTEHIKGHGGSWFAVAHNTTSGKNQNPVNGTKAGGDWFATYAEQKSAGTISPGRLYSSGSQKWRAASALIAKIPFPLAQHIARCFKPSSGGRQLATNRIVCETSTGQQACPGK